MARMVGQYVYVVMQFMAFILAIVGFQLDMFRVKVDIPEVNPCITLWGAKVQCNTVKVDKKPDELFKQCDGRLKRWQAAEAVSILSIIALFTAFVMGIVLILRRINCLRFVCLGISLFAVVSILVVVVIMVDAYNKPMDKCIAFHLIFKFGVGFALVWASWVLNLFSIAFLMTKQMSCC